MIELTVPRDPLTMEGQVWAPSSSLQSSLQMSSNSTDVQRSAVFTSRTPWSSTRPKALVVACSDGRLQESIDEFLAQHLGIIDYDRLYAPGGPGILVPGGYELLRADQFRREFTFLMKAHGTQEVILLFHGTAEEGPDEAVCAHYKRLLPRASCPQIARQQEEDAAEILRQAFVGLSHVRVQVYRAEVRGDRSVRFVNLKAGNRE